MILEDQEQGWIWACQVHESRGECDLLAEAQHLASAHLTFWASPIFKDQHPHLEQEEAHAESITIERAIEGEQS
jgi:hypothetical protein